MRQRSLMSAEVVRGGLYVLPHFLNDDLNGGDMRCQHVDDDIQCRLDATRRVIVAGGDPPDPDQSGFAWTIYLVQVCKEHDPDPRRCSPLTLRELASARTSSPELPPRPLVTRLRNAVGLVVSPEVFFDFLEVLLRRCLVVRKPPSTDPTPIAHAHERTGQDAFEAEPGA
jgi:hypothetical protein